jgi:hypothetical protein
MVKLTILLTIEESSISQEKCLEFNTELFQNFGEFQLLVKLSRTNRYLAYMKTDVRQKSKIVGFPLL